MGPGEKLDARIAHLEAENKALRSDLDNALLLIYRPASAYLSADAFARHLAKRYDDVSAIVSRRANVASPPRNQKPRSDT